MQYQTIEYLQGLSQIDVLTGIANLEVLDLFQLELVEPEVIGHNINPHQQILLLLPAFIGIFDVSLQLVSWNSMLPDKGTICMFLAIFLYAG
jgi:hypothetical protein